MDETCEYLIYEYDTMLITRLFFNKNSRYQRKPGDFNGNSQKEIGEINYFKNE